MKKEDQPHIESRLHPDAWSEIVEEHPDLVADMQSFSQSGLDQVFSVVGAYTLLRLRARHLLRDLRGDAQSDETAWPSDA